MIVDERHDVGAVLFTAIAKRTKVMHVLSLASTPIRRGGLRQVNFIECGPISYTAARLPVPRSIWKWISAYASHPWRWTSALLGSLFVRNVSSGVGRCQTTYVPQQLVYVAQRTPNAHRPSSPLQIRAATRFGPSSSRRPAACRPPKTANSRRSNAVPKA